MSAVINENEKLIDSPATTRSVALSQQERNSQLPSHLMALPGGPWAVWRCVGVRGAGFPASLVLNLSAVEAAAAADRLLDVEEESAGAERDALEALRDDLEGADADQRHSLLTAIQRLKKGKLPKSLQGAPAAQARIEELHTASQRCDSTTADFHQLFDEAAAHTSEAISHIAAHERFREALIWQNRHAFRTGVAPLVQDVPAVANALTAERSHAPARTSKQRQREELVATYLQRYCVKNDTIGFFGPMSWATLIEKGAAMSVRPGTEMLAARYVRFEGWAIDVLAEQLSAVRELRPWLAPRRVPFIHQQGLVLHLPGGQAIKIGVKEGVVLQASDGQRSAKEIAAAVMRIEKLGIKSVEEVYAVLAELEQKQLLSWTLEVPVQKHPDNGLRQLIERIEDEDLRRPGLEALAQLSAARENIINAGGDAEKLNQAMSELEATFTGLTNTAATRSHGKTYAGRTVIYEDCRRDIEIEVGPELLEGLGAPLSVLLTSARWFTYEAANIYRKASQQIYAELVGTSGSPIIDAVTFWERSREILYNKNVVAPLQTLFQEKWGQILDISADEHQLTYSSEQLREPVLAAFDAPRPGWRSACYHSPDVMIAAASAEAISRGEYQLVMGELHIGGNTFKPSCFVYQHPAPEELIAALDADIPEPRLVPITPKGWPNMNSRTQPALVSAKDFRLIISSDAYAKPNSRALPIGSLVVEETAAGLVLRTRDGLLQFDIVEACAEAFTGQVIQRFNIMKRTAHSPRITIDQLIVCRETWRFSPSALAFAFERDEATRFLAARRFARAHGLPRFVFVKVPVEIKPFYVDLASPVLVNVLAKMVRRTAEQEAEDAVQEKSKEQGQGQGQEEEQGSSSLAISVSEMMPRGDESWLEDAGGERYTSELRIVAVDPLAP